MRWASCAPRISRCPRSCESARIVSFFYSADAGEPPHVHVVRDASEAKFWTDPVRLERSRGFSAQELRDIETMNDPIVDEVRRIRDAHAAKFNYDPDAIFRDIKEQEKRSGRK